MQDYERAKEGGSVPAYYVNVMEHLTDLNQWNISEQGYWGIPVPYFKRENGEVLANQEITRYVSQIFRDNGGAEAWNSMSVFDLLPPRYKDEASDWQKGDHVFDVSFDTALSWDFALRSNERP